MAYFYVMLFCTVVLAIVLTIAWFLSIDDDSAGEIVACSFMTALMVLVIYIFCTDVKEAVRLDGMARYDKGEYVKEVTVKEVYTDGTLTKVDSLTTFIKKID